MNNLKKGVQIGVLGAALTAGTLVNTGCPQPTDNTIDDNQSVVKPNEKPNENVNQNAQPYDKAIGNYNFHNFLGENPDWGLNMEEDVTIINDYLKQAETYTKGLATKFEQSLNGRPAAKNYFSEIINNMKNNNYFHVDKTMPGDYHFDQAINVNYKEGDAIFADIIRNTLSTDSAMFYYYYRILANEAYKEGLGNNRNYAGPLMDNYNREKDNIVGGWNDNNGYATNIDLEQVYAQNNFTFVTNAVDQLLGKFVNNINAKQNLNLRVSDMQQFLNITFTLNTLGAMHDSTKAMVKHDCGTSRGIGYYLYTMEKAADEIWQEEQQQQQDQNELSR